MTLTDAPTGPVVNVPDIMPPYADLCPVGYCPFCGEVAHARACTPLRALLFAPTYCSSCGDPCPYRICAACLESNLALQNARDALERGMVTEGWHVELIIARLRAHARQSWAV